MRRATNIFLLNYSCSLASSVGFIINAPRNAWLRAVFSDPQVAKALEEEEGLEFLLVTNSILPKEKGWDSKKIRTLSVAPLLAEAILRHSQKQSLADMLIFSEE